MSRNGPARTSRSQSKSEALRSASWAKRLSERFRPSADPTRQQQSLLRGILDNATAMISLKDADGRFVLVNQKFQQVFRTTQENVIGKTDHDLFPAYIADALRANDRRALRAGALEREEVLPHDGEEHTYFSIKFPLFDGEGSPYAICSISTDITERKKVEARLKESKDRVHEIIDTAHEAFVSMDECGVITFWNRQAELTFGWPRAKVLGRNLADTIIPERYREAHRRGLDHFLVTGQGPVFKKRLEVEALHRDGHEFPIELTISAMRVRGGYTFNAFLHDLSERKTLEDATSRLAELTQELTGGR
jgi:PAS domain S-box-containing protein